MKDKKLIYILSVIIIIFIVVSSYLIYNNIQKEKIRIKQQTELDELYIDLDSVSNVLNDKILTISQLGGDIDSLLILKENIETEKREFRNRAYAQINRLQGKVDGYRELLLAQDEEIEKLKKLNEQLFEENKEQKVEINTLNDKITNINRSNKKLEEQIEIAGRLEIKDIEIVGVFRNGSTKINSFKNRSLNKLIVNFTVLENSLSKIEVLDIYLRIIKPSGQVVYDISKGSGSFTFDKRELFYSIKDEILIDKSEMTYNIEYVKSEELNKGEYQVILYTNNYEIGRSEFIIK
ncbi:MAG: chromosome segregation protein SMC [Bacteroidota bacterium]|nr:chromosome segregation protein SMC [Bacteroidota bacterium]|tara:strand:- start:308 stop:1186 length:879 start_codon:yes stop_codon:yes gene_type:complete